ncbi:hypothetical protein K431DRAFT_129148 [Polychaeton citri CBS 116435]|uniref:Uncharacterized protein n=1 Tax=Polychaeton citri CBS 116435 TaxID=1314669 RepID=A0A9P4Q131_9PEZI|nr:hypothetical protein K431DRAFT_129148 [Polychaeton citri CBS 116435]
MHPRCVPKRVYMWGTLNCMEIWIVTFRFAVGVVGKCALARHQSSHVTRRLNLNLAWPYLTVQAARVIRAF